MDVHLHAEVNSGHLAKGLNQDDPAKKVEMKEFMIVEFLETTTSKNDLALGRNVTDVTGTEVPGTDAHAVRAVICLEDSLVLH